MITINEAEALVLAHSLHLDAESVSLAHAHGRALAQDLFADHDLPPFHRVMMDGIALQHAALINGQHSFVIQGIQRAGAPASALLDPTQAIEVMTGSVLPLHCDTVIPYEELSIADGVAPLNKLDFKWGQNIHPQGFDFPSGALLAQKGTTIHSGIIGIAASIGQSTILVERAPRIAIVSTGDELVSIDSQPAPHQIRRSNAHALQSLVARLGWTSRLFHLNDNEADVSSGLDEVLQHFDVVLLSGGVSKGKFDLLPTFLEQKGVVKHFHFVQQKPGKPFWFGSRSSTLVFAFPGNPVSTLVCAHRYFVPWALQQQGARNLARTYVCLNEDVEVKGSLEHLISVRLTYPPNSLPLAHLVAGHGSGDFAHLASVDGFVQTRTAKKGSIVPFFALL